SPGSLIRHLPLRAGHARRGRDDVERLLNAQAGEQIAEAPDDRVDFPMRYQLEFANGIHRHMTFEIERGVGAQAAEQGAPSEGPRELARDAPRRPGLAALE